MIELLVGHSGSGKSHYAKSTGCSIVSRDDIRYRLNNGEYQYNPAIEPLVASIFDAELEARLKLSQDVIVDGVHMSAASRRNVLALAKRFCVPCIATILPDKGMEACVSARMKDNHGSTARKVWEAVYCKNKKAWEPPTEEEGFDRVIYL